jgi:hypothetical protein
MKEQLEFSVSEEWQRFIHENSWVSFVPESAKDSDGVEYLRKKGSETTYRKTDDGYRCTTCDSEIISGRVAHPIWDGPFPMSGSGRCHYEEVPYCPKCEKEPNFSGRPIRC